jgi:5-(carboxyamino)imidazole ribonucleotide synthase
LREVASLAPLRPGAEPVRIIQDKTLQKAWLEEHGFPVGPFRVVRSEGELHEAVAALGGSVYLKIGHGGYDGRGQAQIGMDSPATEEAVAAAWKAIGERPAVAEQALDLECEISVMAVRNPSGEVRAYPAARNHHENQILAWSVLPAGVPGELEASAEKLATELVEGLGIDGLLCAEIFITRKGELFINELAPRPHNSYHQSERGCATSQFEQLVRAVCNLPLGDTSLISPAAIVNLLGDVWLKGAPNFAAALAIPGVRLHLYEKHTPRAGRKMGHLSATGATAEEALERVLEAKKKL